MILKAGREYDHCDQSSWNHVSEHHAIREINHVFFTEKKGRPRLQGVSAVDRYFHTPLPLSRVPTCLTADLISDVACRWGTLLNTEHGTEFGVHVRSRPVDLDGQSFTLEAVVVSVSGV